MRKLVRWTVAAGLSLATVAPVFGQIDFTGDGRIEVAFGDPGSSTLTILDGASGQELWRVTDTDMLGWAASAHPDVDGDGRADVLVTAPGTGAGVSGRVVAMRGHDGSVLWTCTFGAPSSRFGFGLGVIPDQDSDHVADLLVAMLSNDPSGETIVLVSGKTGRVLATAPGPMAPMLSATRSGHFAFKTKDLDGSGVVDMADALAVATATHTGDEAADLDFSGTVDVEDILKVIDEMVAPSPAQMLPGQYALLSLEDPLRYNDGYQMVALVAQPFQPTPPSEPCAAERDAARLAALEYARIVGSPPGTLNPFDWNRWRNGGGHGAGPILRGFGCVERMPRRAGSSPAQAGGLAQAPASASPTAAAATTTSTSSTTATERVPAGQRLSAAHAAPRFSSRRLLQPDAEQHPRVHDVPEPRAGHGALRRLPGASQGDLPRLQGTGGEPVRTSVSVHRDRRPLHRRGGAVALSAALAGLLCGGCDERGDSALMRSIRPLCMEATQPIGPKAHVPTPAHHPVSDAVGDGPAQPEDETPTLSFLGPRPPEFPFRMEFTEPPDPPAVLELSPFAPGMPVQDRLRRVLRDEISRYPAGTLGVVDTVIIGSTLAHNGRSVGASYMMGLVFIAAGEQDAGAATDAHVVRAFHHEVSSLLLHGHRAKFNEAEFRAALPEGFVYRDDRPGADPEAPLDPEEDTPSLELLHEGFLLPWATRNMEQDFNSYAEVLLQRPGLLLETFAPESRVGRKAQVVRDFYVAIDRRFEGLFAPAGAAP